ncbi:carboxypeptidase-like regulatory domain-containing protein [Rosettibacter firmus]|uniref:carboxypeptidase-like regulatory domain-containing protein n=1 Tax=Rosettibacter firmus TaxID=3111522 RepID=UPI00336BBF5E
MIIKDVFIISIFLLLFEPALSWANNFSISNNPHQIFNGLKENRDTIKNFSKPDSSLTKPVLNTSDNYFDEREEAYFYLIYKDVLRSRIITLYTNNSFYIPLLELLKLLEINFNTNLNEKIITGFFIEEDSTYTFNFTKLTYQDKHKSFIIANDDFIFTPLEIYIKPELLKKAFNISTSINLNDLSINLITEKNLPILMRVKRETLYKYISKETIVPDFYYPLTKKYFYGLLFDYFISSNFTKGLPAFYNYNIGVGGIVLGGTTEINLNGSLNQKYHSINDYTYNWSYVFNKKSITQISLGTNEYNGLQQSIFNGIKITNEPVEPRKNFYNYVISNYCGPNWTVELYVNNKLTDVTKADANGFFNFNIPLQYGTTFIHLKYYSPEGKYITTRRLFQIPIRFIPPGEFNYTINIGRITYNNNLVGNILGTYGITESITNSIGIEFLENNSPKKFFLYNEFNARLGSSNIFSFTLAPDAYYRIGFNTLFYSQTAINILATKYYKSSFHNPFNINEDFQFDFFSPLDFRNISFGFGTIFKLQNSSDIKNKYFGLNIGAKTEYFNPSISFKQYLTEYKNYTSKQSYLSSGIIIPLRFLDNILRSTSANLINLQVNYDISRNKFVQYNITYSTEFFSQSRLEIIYNNVLNSGSYFQCGLVINFPYIKNWSTITNNNIFTNIYGSIAYDAEINRYSFYNRSQVGKSSIICRFFLDKNGNNKYDKDETLINDAEAFLETPCSMEKAGDGIIKLRELNPYTTYIIRVNESIKNGFLIPAFKTIAIQTEPNTSKIIDIPFYEATEIYGSVTLLLNDNSRKSLNGIKIVFENLNDGYRFSTTTFSDGTFYLSGIKPSNYKIYIDPEQLKALKCVSFPENIIYNPGNYDNTLENINFELKIIE